MSIINLCEKENLKLNAEKSKTLGLINGVEHIISSYNSNKEKAKILYESTYSRYNELKSKVESLESQIYHEKTMLNTLEKVLNINYNLYIQNEESLNKYVSTLESYQRKLRTIEIDIKINEMQKAISQLENERKNYN